MAMEDAVQQELGGLVENKVEESSFSISETPEQKLNYVLTGETTVEPDPNKVLKFTHKHLMKGYVRQKGLGTLYRAILRVAVNPSLCSLWIKELEAILEEERDLALEELKELLASEGARDVGELRQRGATEHELEQAGLPAARLDVVRYAKEAEAVGELAEKITSLKLRKDDARSDHIVKALGDLTKLKTKLNGFVKETMDLHQLTTEILSNVGDATKFAREMRTTLDESANEKQQQLEHFQLLLPSPDAANRGSAGNSAVQMGERRLSYAGRSSFANRASFSARALSMGGGGGGIVGERKISSVGMERKLSAVGQSFLRTESFSNAAGMSRIFPTQPVRDEFQVGRMLLKAGMTLYKMCRAKPSRAPRKYVFRYEDDLLKWNTRNGASPVIVLDASSGLPSWLDQDKLMKNSWVKKRFRGLNDALLSAIKLTVGHSLVGTDKFEMLLFSESPDIAKNILAGFEDLNGKMNDIQENSNTSEMSDANALSFTIKSRSRAKTLVNQSDSFDPEVTKSGKKKRKSMSQQESLPQLVKTGQRQRVAKKTEDRDFILSIMKKNKIFINLEDSMLDDIVQIMRKVTVTDGMEMAIQGTFATNFYIIQEGRLEAYDEYMDNVMSHSSRLKAVYSQGDFFGDTSLIFKCPFLYSIVARTDCVLWALDQETFSRALVSNKEIQKTIETLVEVPIFNALDDGLFSDTVLKFEIKNCKPEEVIVEEDSPATHFYVLMDGRIDLKSNWYGVTKEGINERSSKSMTLPGQCFGDFEICFNQKHNSQYVAGDEGATLLSLKLEYFENISKFLMQATDIVLRMNVLYSLPIFASLTEEQVKEVAESFDFEEFTEGTTIIKKGEKGNKFYFLKRGKVSVLDMVQGELKMVNQIRGHGSFGELALLNDDPRNAFVVAETDVELYSLKREDFRKLVNLANDSTAREKINKVLSGIESLSRLSKMDISVLAETMECKKITEGQKLVSRGEINDRLYIISKGELVLTKRRENQDELERVRLLPGNFFGDKALLKTGESTFDVTAARLSEVFVLSREILENACGSLEDIKQKDRLKTEEEEKLSNMTAEDFVDEGIIGRGAFGMVKLVMDKESKKYYAMKSLKKHDIVKKKHQKHLVQEIKMLENLDHEMIIRLRKKWQDERYIYLLTDVCSGGDLYQEIKRNQGFSEEVCKFYVACLISIFSHLRAKSIVYRDLKPENILLADDGYLKLIDFGLAKELKEGKKANTICGTPEYVAPEILLNEGYGPSVDIWSIGILLYEMVTTKTPFASNTSKSVLNNILQKNIQFSSKKFEVVSEDCTNFIESCLKKEKNLRLGAKSMEELRSHPWFKNYSSANWNAIDRKVYPVPYKPEKKPADMQILQAKKEELELPPAENDYELDTIFETY